MFKLPYYNAYEHRPSASYNPSCVVRERDKKIFKTQWRSVAYAMVRQGFEIISRKGDGINQARDYTLYGDEGALTNRQFQAVDDGVIRKIGFEKRKQAGFMPERVQI